MIVDQVEKIEQKKMKMKKLPIMEHINFFLSLYDDVMWCDEI